MFEKPSRSKVQLSEEEKEDIIALLGSRYSEANNN
jgi:hypothetical protein